MYEMYKKYYRELPVSEKIWKELVTLPLYPDLTEEDFELITGTIKEFYS